MQNNAEVPGGVKWLYAGFIIFAVLAVFSLTQEFYWTLALPFVAGMILVTLFRLDLLLLLSVIVTPLSINLQKTSLGIGVSLPSEPLMFGIMLVFFIRQLYYRDFDIKIFRHPVSIAILLHILWMLVTSLTGTMPVVSLKATLARICFVTLFFYMASKLFSDLKKIQIFMWCYMIPLMGVIAYTTMVHAAAGFTEKAAHTAMTPFYNDHTAYAVVIAMFVPLLFGWVSDKESSKSNRTFAFITLVVMLTAIVLSYTRASWISLLAALGCYAIFALKINRSVIIGVIGISLAFIIGNWTRITMELERNDKQSSTDYESHVESVTNITTDASNVERINRWDCAFRMFAEKPFLGWGPGTYMFQYAPFQKFSQRTIISTNFGEGGNAHSEYIGPMAEQGILGPVFFIAIGLLIIFRASAIIRNNSNPKIRMLTKSFLLGLVTYWVHGMLNNFLDTEKASVLFWSFAAVIVAIDVYHHRAEQRITKSEHSEK